VPLTPRQQQLLEAHLARLAEERARLGTDWKEHGLLFLSTRGTPIVPRNLNRHFYDLLVGAGVIASAAPPEKQPGMSGPRRTKRIATGDKEALHKLRHTAATRFDTVKATKAQQKAIMGHSPGDVTEGYVHPPLSELRAVLAAAEREMLRWAAERGSRPATKRAGY
jgi:integrase